MVLTLDTLSNKIQVYRVDCSLFKTVKPHQQADQKEVIILSFAWSNRQRRVLLLSNLSSAVCSKTSP